MNGIPRFIGYAIDTDRRIIYTGEDFTDWSTVKDDTRTSKCFALLDLDTETLTVTTVIDDVSETQTQPMDRKNAVAMYYKDLEAEKQANLDWVRETTGEAIADLRAARATTSPGSTPPGSSFDFLGRL